MAESSRRRRRDTVKKRESLIIHRHHEWWCKIVHKWLANCLHPSCRVTVQSTSTRNLDDEWVEWSAVQCCCCCTTVFLHMERAFALHLLVTNHYHPTTVLILVYKNDKSDLLNWLIHSQLVRLWSHLATSYVCSWLVGDAQQDILKQKGT